MTQSWHHDDVMLAGVLCLAGDSVHVWCGMLAKPSCATVQRSSALALLLVAQLDEHDRVATAGS
eukprot:m.180853 g.180853  ORF g.180853 m.180853 type:complete len:64 (-) comp9992_c0_seq27:1182-1373(-)